MKCQKCKVNDATTQIKRIVNGKYTEYTLCADCAHEMGFGNVFDTSMPDMFGGLIKSIFGSALPARSQATRCPMGGSTYGDIKNTGKVGCAACYEIFYGELLRSIKGIHGNTQHCGKIPRTAKLQSNLNDDDNTPTTEDLQVQLQKAVEEQNFELAAELRDRIKEREGK